MSYNAIVQMIKTTPDVLYLHVLPKECDVLQMSYRFAHTPESNISATTSPLHHNKLIEFPHASAVAAAAAASVPQQTLVSSHHFTTSTPGTGGGGMIPIYPHTKHQQPQAQQQQQHIHKNMISYSDSTYSSIQQRKAMTMSTSSPLSPSSMSSSGQQQQLQSQPQHHHHNQHHQKQQSSSSNEVVYSDINPSSLALRNDGTLIR